MIEGLLDNGSFKNITFNKSSEELLNKQVE